MTLLEAIKVRRSIRKYNGDPIREETRENIIKRCKKLGELSHIKFIPKFDVKGVFNPLVTFGAFKNAYNYIAVIAPKDYKEDTLGYFSEQLVLYLETLGIGSCFVGASYSRFDVKIKKNKDEKIFILIAFGLWDFTELKPRKSKKPTDVSNVTELSPNWFKEGVIAALLAPTALNQQKFYIELINQNTVSIKSFPGPFSLLDKGIVKCNFEIAAGKDNFTWI